MNAKKRLPHPHDFSKALRLHTRIERYLEKWLRDTSSAFEERLRGLLPFEPELKYVGIATQPFQEVLREINSEIVAIEVILRHETNSTLLVMPRSCMQMLVSGMLGEVPSEVPTPKRLSFGDSSIAQYLIEEFATAAKKQWISSKEELYLSVRNLEFDLARTRVVRPDQNVVMSTLSIRMPLPDDKHAEMNWWWIVRQEPMIDMLNDAHRSLNKPPQNPQERSMLSALLLEMNAELQVRLGTATVDAADLRRMQVGDVVLLDQSIREPLGAYLAGKEFYRVWAGRVGLRRAMQVESIVDK